MLIKAIYLPSVRLTPHLVRAAVEECSKRCVLGIAQEPYGVFQRAERVLPATAVGIAACLARQPPQQARELLMTLCKLFDVHLVGRVVLRHAFQPTQLGSHDYGVDG